jgi:hypothetical protein
MGCIRACRRGCRGGRNTLSVLPLLRDPDTAALTDFAQRQIVRLGRRSPCRRVCRRWAPASEHERASANRLHPRGRLVFDALRPRLGRLLGHARRPSRHRQPEHVAIPQWCRAFLPVSAGFFRHVYIKTIVLPRQARDKHRETTQKRMAMSSSSGCLSRLGLKPSLI